MKSLILILFGASGSGKTSLVEQVAQMGNSFSIHMKVSDRPKRAYDDYELSCTSNFNPREFEYIYQTYGHRYGISKKQIDEAISNNQHHLIICNDISTIRSIKRDYGEIVKVIFHFFDAPRDEVKKIQIGRNIADDEIELRLAKTAILYRQFVEEWELFDGTITNHFGDQISSLRISFEKLVFQLSNKTKTSNLENEIKSIVKSINSENTESAPSVYQANYAFIIMPIRGEDNENEDVHQTIKRVCNTLNIKAERVDDIQYTGQISEKIQGCIELSEFVIADLTHERPNVYYEIGYADAKRKSLILIAKDGTQIHFDIQGMNILFYKGMYHLEQLLENTIKCIKNKKK